MRRTRQRSNFRLPQHRFVRSGKQREENVIPMINVIFLLLLYFMVAGNLDSDFDIDLPVSTLSTRTEANTPVVNVERNGNIWFESRNMDITGLTAELAGTTGNGKLRIHADANVDALVISNIMKAAAQAGIFRFALVTQSRVDAP
ncbi:MAG: biopolymer transporter ExbD [Gammaproteobacteria bacterium]|nr:biopolymer transporter ExbD [Gammaproteobacteria bacterium]